MVNCKFGIGQQVRHLLTDALGIVVDMDASYGLQTPTPDTLIINEALLQAPWYYVVLAEEDSGETTHTYIAESQLTGETASDFTDHPALDDIAEQVRLKSLSPSCCH